MSHILQTEKLPMSMERERLFVRWRLTEWISLLSGGSFWP